MKTRNLSSLPIIMLGILVAWPGISGFAQETPKAAEEAKTVAQTKTASVYHLIFVVRELEGDKTVNSRTYSLSVRERDWGRIRTGNRVPIQFGENSVNYQDVGINIDCQVQERDAGVLLDTKFTMSGLASPQEILGKSPQPVFRNLSLEEQPEVSLGKPTIIGKVDDVGTNHHFEFEVTATKAK